VSSSPHPKPVDGWVFSEQTAPDQSTVWWTNADPSLFIDVFVRLDITTVFEYLEARFNRAVSLIMLTAYVAFRCLYAGIVVYTLSLVLHVTMGFPLRMTMVGVGVDAIMYTTFGGIRAVIWTDVIQFFIMVGGLVVAITYAIGKLPGGFTEAYHTAAEAGKLRLVNLDFDLTQRYVLWTLIPYGLVDFLGTKGVDQMNVQRFLSARSGSSAKLAMLVQSCFTLPVWLLLFTVGMSLFAYYARFPSEQVSEYIAAGQYDRIFPYYVHSVMPVGIRGLMIAALMAAAMSTMDSVLNVLSTISVTNVYRRLVRPEASDRQCVRVAKGLTVVWGCVVIAAAFSMIRIESILKTVNSVIGIFVGPMAGLFLLGLMTKRANSPGARLGFAGAMSVSLYMKFGTDITFTLMGVTGMSVTLAIGRLGSLLFARPAESQLRGLLWRWRGWREMLFD